jgi:hypothetical protein
VTVALAMRLLRPIIDLQARRNEVNMKLSLYDWVIDNKNKIQSLILFIFFFFWVGRGLRDE